MDTEIAKPLLKSGTLYMWELLRCVLLGIVLSGAMFVAYIAFGVSGQATGRSLGSIGILLLSLVLFPVLYGLAGHQRGIGRVLATLTQAHGGLLYDQTVGRFIEWAEARSPGTMVATLSSPQQLLASFKTYLSGTSGMPQLIQRVSLHYVTKLGARVGEGKLLPPNLVSYGQFNGPVFKTWAIEHMRDGFEPSWKGVGIVMGLHLLASAAAVWWLR